MVLGVLVSAHVVRAQDTVTVSGTIRDAETGDTLPYATVLIEGGVRGAAANVDGYFVLVGVPVGTYILRVRFLGYMEELVEVDTSVLDGPLDIELEPSAAVLNEVEIVADAYQFMKTAESISKITVSPRDVAVLPNVGEVDIFRSLQLLPGISGTNEGSSGLYVRGGTPDQNLVILDGMTVYHVDHFFGFFSAFNAEAIKDVQVYKGGFPAKYGGRTSGVVELTGRNGQDSYGLGANVNLLSAGLTVEAPLGTNASILVASRRSYTDVLRTGLYSGIYGMLTGEDQSVPGGSVQGGGPGGGGRGALGGRFAAQNQATVQPDFFFYDLNAKLNYRPSGKDVLALSFYNGQDNLDESRLISNEIAQGQQVGGTIVNDVYDITGWGNLGVSGTWMRQWTPTVFSNALVAWSQYYSENTRDATLQRLAADTDSVLFSRSGGNVEDNRLGDLTAQLDNIWQLSQGHQFSFGAQLTRSNVQYENVRNDSLVVFDETDKALQLAGYVQDTWQVTPRLQFTGGMRIATYNNTGRAYVEPRASMRIDLTSRLRLKAAYGHYNQFVARVVNENVTEGARDFWLLANDDNVGVQGSTHYVTGASYETPVWLVDVEAYRKEMTGLSEFSLRFRRGGAEFEADDLFFDGSGVAQGLELLLQRKAGRFTGWLSYTLARVEHTFGGLNGNEPFPALHDQPHELKLVGSTRLGRRWNLSATWAIATGKPYTSPESQYTITLLDGSEQSFIHVGGKNAVRLPAYHRLDASVHYRLPVGTSDIDFGLSVFNLYNRTNVWYREFDLTESPYVTTDITFLGLTPNVSARVNL